MEIHTGVDVDTGDGRHGFLEESLALERPEYSSELEAFLKEKLR